MIELLDRLLIWLFLLFISIFLVLISIFLPITIHEREELGIAMFGYPVPFAQQDLMQAGVDYLGDYPYKFTIGLDFLDHPSRIYIYKIPFLLSVIVVYVGLLIIRYLHNRFLF
ncbi:hypothetical protein ACLHDF_22905 [Priestia aryabhattai]|uniref:hypothetical protein n=1 Tax=Priestia megaterium TaxID=1404 RepID=UPI0039B9C37E